MKKQILLLAAAMALFSCEKSPKGSTYDVPTPSFAKGADVSWVSEMEAGGKTFKTRSGSQADIFESLASCGINSIRLRVWVKPSGGWSGKADVAALAERAAKAGMALMIDFHYSDFFADPSRQDIPADWVADKADIGKMCDHVKDHTTDVLNAIKAKGVTPAWIQIGNETRNGMLWPVGQLWETSYGTPGGWANFAKLYKAGYYAAKEVFPNAKVMPHVNNAYADNAWWFTSLKEQGGTFDMIALSHYPQAESKMTPSEYNAAAIAKIKALNASFRVPVMVSEVGVKTPDGEATAKAVLKEFMDAVRKLPATTCAGVFYWEPEVYDWWKPAIYSSKGWNAYGMGAYLSGGRPSSVMDVFAE